MKYVLILLVVIIYHCSEAQNAAIGSLPTTSPLAAFSDEWNEKIYTNCNTAKDAVYMNENERTVIYILNLARSYPKLFASTVLAKYLAYFKREALTDDKYYFQSLVKKMGNMEQLPLLYANEKCYESAACFAKAAGKTGDTGHDRKSKECSDKEYYLGECCYYGNDEPLEIILSLLIVEDVPSLGHLQILPGKYKAAGVSIQPHKTYKINAVLDFYN